MKGKHVLALTIAVAATLFAAAVTIGSRPLPGPATIPSPELEQMAASSASQGINARIIWVRCPAGNYGPGAVLSCTGEFGRAYRGSVPLRVAVSREEDGSLEVEVARMKR